MALRVRYFMGESISNLRRNLLMTLAAMSTVAVSLFLLGAVIVIGHVVKQVVGNWEEKVEVNVFLKDDIAADQRDALGKDLVGMPEVAKVDFVTKEKAYSEYKQMFKNSPQLVQNVDPAALPASFRVKLKDPSQVDAIRVRVEGRPGIDEVTYGGDVIKRLLRIIGLLRSITFVMTLILLGAAILLIANTIRLAVYARRREIGIMKLVGATNWFVRVPFIFEGIVEAGFGALMAAFLIWLGNAVVLEKVQKSIPFLPVLVGGDFIGKVFLLLLGVGILVGAMGSTLALRRHLEV
jgi:cell division transport system permease protein